VFKTKNHCIQVANKLSLQSRSSIEVLSVNGSFDIVGTTHAVFVDV